MDKVDRLYDIYSILADAGDMAKDHESEYLEIIEAVKGSTQEKGLACQFIPKFVNHFPHLSQTALEAQIDLAEDDDITVRKMAVKNFPAFCKICKQFVPKIADILTQMLMSEDSAEIATVQASLVAIMELDIKGTLQGILIQISTTEEDNVRKRALEFLNSKLKVLPEDVFTKEAETVFLESCKKVLPKLPGIDFLSLLSLLAHLKIAKTIPVQNAIVDIIATQLDMDSEFYVSASNVSGFMNFLNQASTFFSPFVSSTRFVIYVCMKVFPKLDEIKVLEGGNNRILEIFKTLAEISVFLQKEDGIEECAETVFKELLSYMPYPPDSAIENASDLDPEIHFSHVECLLFTFVQFLKHDDEIITSEDNAVRFKDFKFRLQFLSRIVMRALKRLKDDKKTAKNTEDEESKKKAIAERTMNNLNALIKDFFRSPPSFKTKVSFSWKPAATTSSDSDVKRSHKDSSSAERFVKRAKRENRQIYQPPSGKYSSRVSFPSFQDRGGRSSRF